MMSSDRGVFFIQKDKGPSCGKRNSIPCISGRSLRYIRPNSRFSSVLAISTETRTGSRCRGNNVTWGNGALDPQALHKHITESEIIQRFEDTDSPSLCLPFFRQAKVAPL